MRCQKTARCRYRRGQEARGRGRKVNNYIINLNSREMIMDNIKLKLTEKEIKALYAQFFPTEEWGSDASSHYFCVSRASSTFDKPFVPCLEASKYLEGSALPSSRATLNFLITRSKKTTTMFQT